MNLRKHLLETATLTLVAILCAVVANAMASRERKLALVGNYSTASPAQEASPLTTTIASEPSLESAGPGSVAPQPVITATATSSKSLERAGAPAPSRDPATGYQKPATGSSGAVGPPPTAASQDLLTRFPPHPDKPYVEISGDDAEWLHSKEVLFLDARRTAVYDQGHIASARPFSVWESDIDEKVKRLFEERGEPDQQLQPIVIYCSGGDCEDSHMLAQKLWGVQFNNIYVYKDGFPDWQKRRK